MNNIEIVTCLEDTVKFLHDEGKDISLEETLTISYQPLSVFRVRPVTRCVETMPGHTDAVLFVLYSPNGKILASGGGDTAIRFWNISACVPMHTCMGHRNHVLCAAWAPNGSSFVSADLSGDIRVWDPSNGKQIGNALRGHRKWVTSLCFEPYHSNAACTRVASASKDHTIRIWNIVTGHCEAVVSGHSDSVESIRWGGTGLLYSASRDRTIKVLVFSFCILSSVIINSLHPCYLFVLHHVYCTVLRRCGQWMGMADRSTSSLEL